GFGVTHMGANRQIDRLWVKRLGLCRPPYPSAVLSACMLSDCLFPTRWATWIPLPQCFCKLGDILTIDQLFACSSTLCARGSQLLVFEACGFRVLDRLLLHE